MSELPDMTGRGDHLVVRKGDRIVPADAEDQAVVATYPGFPDKGPVVDGYRLTVLVSRAVCTPGEAVRVFHLCESTVPDRPLYVMGPKAVLGEYVDDRLVTDPAPAGEDPLAPSPYDGRVVPGPGIDPNYEITEYRFQEPGRHSVQWRMVPHVSNLAWIEVVAPPGPS